MDAPQAVPAPESPPKPFGGIITAWDWYLTYFQPVWPVEKDGQRHYDVGESVLAVFLGRQFLLARKLSETSGLDFEALTRFLQTGPAAGPEAMRAARLFSEWLADGLSELSESLRHRAICALFADDRLGKETVLHAARMGRLFGSR